LVFISRRKRDTSVISAQLLHQILNPYYPLIHILDLHQNFQPILAGERVFAAALDQLDDFERVDRLVGDELRLDAVGAGVDALISREFLLLSQN
jgi:hypothetical protein